jgi:hypothetical protein
VQAAHATRGRGEPVASRTQRGKHARAQARPHDKREEGKRDKAALAASSSGSFQEAQYSGGAKMDAETVVLEELKSGRNSDELANALSLLTSLE